MPDLRDTAPSLRPHRVQLDFYGPAPKYWLARRRLESQLANALGILLPLGECLFLRKAKAALEQVESASLRAQVKGFISQELHHAYQHERSFEVLESLGQSPRCRRDGAPDCHLRRICVCHRYFDGASKPMRTLFLWHAAEEIEHKCVAFDLVQAVNDSYFLRITAMALIAPVFVVLWNGTTAALLCDERPKDRMKALWQWLVAGVAGRLALRQMAWAICQYLRPGFHPRQQDNFGRARAFFSGTGPGMGLTRSARAASR